MPDNVHPIKPSEVVSEKTFPDEVLEAFNGLIARNFKTYRTRPYNGKAIVHENDVLELILDKMAVKGIRRQTILRKRWLDVADVYRSVGWNVSYHRIVEYGKTLKAYFEFST